MEKSNVTTEQPARTVASASMAIEGIPPRMNRLSPGMMYAIAIDQQALRLIDETQYEPVTVPNTPAPPQEPPRPIPIAASP